MATFSELNVRIGATFEALEKGLRGAEKALQRSGQRMANLGSELSIAITAPLALLGRQSIIAAGDIEALGLALESQLGSASAAAEELEKLRKAALLPGLGFEQAVKGSVTLQAVGLSADEARRTIEAFGNGLALAGKGGQELDGVITALSQISAKGVISAEEINQIAERLPQIRTLLKDAFGTADTEALQKLGITAEQFIPAIVAELEKLPKASGGIKNAIENAGDATKQFLATIGNEINKAFGIVDFSEQLSATLQKAAAAFKGLDSETKKAIFTAVGLTVAFGPLVKIIGVLLQTSAAFIGVSRGIVGALKSITGGTLTAADAFVKLSVAQKATAIGIGITIILAAAAAWKIYADNGFDAVDAQERLNALRGEAIQNTGQETTKVKLLSDAVQNEALSEEERIKALNELKRISPEYFGRLDIEKGKVVGLSGAVDSYVNSLIAAAEAQTKVNEIQKNSESIESLRKRRNELEKQLKLQNENARQSQQQAGLGQSGVTLSAQAQARAIESNIDAVLRQIDNLEQVNETIKDSIKVSDIATASTEKSTITRKKSQSEIDKETAAIERKAKALLKEIGLTEILSDKPLLSTPLRGQTIQGIQSDPNIAPPELSLGALVDGLSTLNEIAAAVPVTVAQAITPAQALFNGLSEGVLSFGETWSALGTQVAENGTAIEKVAFAMGDAINSATENGASSLADFASAAVEAGKKVIAILIKEGVAAAVTRALEGSAFALANPLAAVALAGAAGIAASALFSGLLSKVKIPALAEGGITTRPTLAMVGDNPGGKEAIIPLNKLPGLLNRMDSPGGYIAETRISGTDMLILLKKAETTNTRITGKR